MKRNKLLPLILLALSILYANNISAQTNQRLSLDPSQVQWFKEAKFGMFIHWGLYSMLEGSYNGHTMPSKDFKNGNSWYAEWIHTRLEIPPHEYQKLAAEFNPILFDADKWIKEAKDAGIKYFVITSKHHDGFALWDSKVSEYKITNTPYKKDILRQLTDACKKYDIKYGFYYSHWQDWEHPGGAWPNWVPPIKTEQEFETYWQEKALPQVEELITMFDPDLLWFDTWEEEHHINPKRRDELIALVRENSTKCLINGRISFLDPGDNIDFLEMHDNSYPKEILEKPWQTPATMTHSWGWHANDFNWKTSKQMITFLINNASKGGNYLLNIGPKPDGTFPPIAVQRLREIGAWIYSNSEAVYNTKPIKIDVDKNVYLTQSEDESNVFVTLTANQLKTIIPISADRIKSCSVLSTDMPIDYIKINDDAIEILVPQMLYDDCNIPVIRIEL